MTACPVLAAVPGPARRRGEAAVLDVAALDRLLAGWLDAGASVLAPVERDGVLDVGPIGSLDDLPGGRDGGEGRLFGAGPPARSVKRHLLPPAEVVVRAVRTPGGFVPLAPDGGDPPPGPLVLLGVPPCDVHAIAALDEALLRGPTPDPRYRARRRACLVVAVTCARPAADCFCPSTGSGPGLDAVDGGVADLILTELAAEHDGRPHRFLARAGSAAGGALLDGLAAPPAPASDVDAADVVVATAARRITRRLRTAGLDRLLDLHADSPVWAEAGARCDACGRCTAVCPSCSCTTVADAVDRSGTYATRTRVWDSCFDLPFSAGAGRAHRRSRSARYRHWATHKLATASTGTGTMACVGCGRCVAQCPAGIDLTAVVGALWAGADSTPARIGAGLAESLA